MSAAFEFMRDEEQLSLVNIGESALRDVVGENCVTSLTVYSTYPKYIHYLSNFSCVISGCIITTQRYVLGVVLI